MTNIFIDGTWNTPKDNSNIVRLHNYLGGSYYPGPGTKGFFLDKICGGVFGLGTDAIVEQALLDFAETHDGSPIQIFGFSRGAAAARILASEICSLKFGFTVQFLGCFDTVGAFGIPVNILGIPFQKINLFKDMHVHNNVLRASHALALDEKRPAYKHTKMEIRPGITQDYFYGDHWEIGSSDKTFGWMLNQMNKP